MLKLFPHEHFNPKTYINDIALIFASPLHQNNFINSVCLPTPGLVFTYNSLSSFSAGERYTGWNDSYVSGWGVKMFNGQIDSGPPHKVPHVLVSDVECSDVMGTLGEIKPGIYVGKESSKV